MAQFTEILTFQKVMSHFKSQNFCSSASSAHLVDLGHGDQVGVSLNGGTPISHPKMMIILSRKIQNPWKLLGKPHHHWRETNP